MEDQSVGRASDTPGRTLMTLVYLSYEMRLPRFGEPRI